MRERRPSSVAQPGMTAWGRAAERELEAYVRDTALRVPVELPDRVMAAIVAESATPRRGWLPQWPPLRPDRLRMAGGLLAVLVALMGGAVLVAGASAIIGRDVGAPTSASPDSRPILVGAPTAAPTVDVEDATTRPADALEPTRPPDPTGGHDAGEATSAPDIDEHTDEPEPTTLTEETDEPGATDGRDDGDDHVNEPRDTEEPGDDGSSGSSGDGGGPDSPDDSSAF